jgi:hypothetical protein
MSVELDIIHQASQLKNVFLKDIDSEILGCADELLLFLNRLQDLIKQNPKIHIPLPFISDIVYGLESNPDATLLNRDIRDRFLDLLTRLTMH